ncbi:MAG: hypothetical protein R6V85_07720 [Polyangia bacterium]
MSARRPVLAVAAIVAILGGAAPPQAVFADRGQDPALESGMPGSEKNDPLSVEQRLHLRRLAELAKIRVVARQTSDSELLEEATALGGRERWRHRQVLFRLAAGEEESR